MKEYRIYIKSNEHPRTINTPKMARCYYSVIKVYGNRDDLVAKAAELVSAGETINEICTGYGCRIWQ